jgi:hypothetical protein
LILNDLCGLLVFSSRLVGTIMASISATRSFADLAYHTWSVPLVRANAYAHAYHASNGVECFTQIEDSVHWHHASCGLQSVKSCTVCRRDQRSDSVCSNGKSAET